MIVWLLVMGGIVTCIGAVVAAETGAQNEAVGLLYLNALCIVLLGFSAI